jgi:broad specificity phosphatase PhoE
MSHVPFFHKAALAVSQVAICVGLLLLNCDTAYAQKVVYIVRHAERLNDSDDSPISPAGHARAKALAAILKDAKIKGIYISHWTRTKETAQPFVDVSHITPEKIQDGDATATFDKIKANHSNDAVLIVGHSHTVQPLLKKWVPQGTLDIGNEFDNMIVITPNGENTGWVRLKYGARSTTP